MAKQLELYDNFQIRTSVREDSKNMVLSDSGSVKGGASLICSVAATHAGTLINNRVYPPEGMRKGIKSWTNPYKKPVLVNHDEEKDPVGRVIKAKYTKTPKGMSGEDYKPVLKPSDGYGYIDLTVKITDSGAIEKILDGRYDTVSVRMSTDHAICSVCGVDWADEGPCEHRPGKKYEDGLAYITTGNLSYREVSFVNIPADEYARVEGSVFDQGDNESSEPINMKIYANNAEEKVLCDMSDENRNNLYDQLRDEYDEEEDTISHLIDKAVRVNDRKEDQMSKEIELTKEQLTEMDAVKELIQEAKDEANSASEEQLKKLQEDLAKLSGDSESGELTKELDGCKETINANQEAQKALAREKDSLEQERDQLKDDFDKREEERTTLVDENVTLNSELHKLQAERLCDLKLTLKKPDVAEIETIEDRDKKVEEFAQRSIDSLKDQINDLLIEKAAQPDAPKPSLKVENPGVVHKDEEKKELFKNTKETKGETLNRLFKSND